jgi:hypothetical protein
MSNLDSNIKKGRLLVGAIQRRDVKTSERLWELADLTADTILTSGGDRRSEFRTGTLNLEEWAEEIGWVERGNSISTLKKMVAEARAWHKDRRLADHTFWQHFEARTMHEGDVTAARKWLKGRKGNITEQARENILDDGPVSDIILQLIKARRRILSVPAKLAEGNVRGTEENFDRLRYEVRKLHQALGYLDRFLADEVEFDYAALDEALDRILSEEEVA